MTDFAMRSAILNQIADIFEVNFFKKKLQFETEKNLLFYVFSNCRQRTTC
jgi:hypothetical protein